MNGSTVPKRGRFSSLAAACGSCGASGAIRPAGSPVAREAEEKDSARTWPGAPHHVAATARHVRTRAPRRPDVPADVWPLSAAASLCIFLYFYSTKVHPFVASCATGSSEEIRSFGPSSDGDASNVQ